MSAPSPAEFVAGLLPRLRSGSLCFFPIRHHSPACAAHLRRWIATRRPVSVLIEGPASFTDFVDALTDERTACPVALYTSFVDKRGRLRGDTAGELPPGVEPPRFTAYYPFCDHTPELVALRDGRAAGARVRFVDLEYGEMVLAGHAAAAESPGLVLRVDSLASDPHLKHSEYVRELARRLGCRDFNEVWDHLFESGDTDDPDAFADRLAAYCAMARLDYTDDHLHADGTLAREDCMAAAVIDELARNEAEGRTGPVLVVTGGLHTVALPELVARGAARPRAVAFGEGEVGNWLVRYSFDQLDALAGYCAGMPGPAYYDRLWQALAEGPDAATGGARVAGGVIVDVARLAREGNLPTVFSTPDAIAALEMARQLATLRGHRWPLREDVLDGVRACFVKGEMGAEGQVVERLVRKVLAGDRVGRLPPGTAVPPIVADFLAEARRFRLPVDTIERREVALDLYRNANHRGMSRFFHRLGLLGAPFASFLSGPDFVQGTGLDLMLEHWQVNWSPATESGLIDAAVYGETVEEAAATRLRQDIARLEDEGNGRSAAAAVTLLVRACRLGLHRQSTALVPLIDVHVAADPSFVSVVMGLAQLELLARSREPLEAGHLTALPRLTAAAYVRACRLLPDVAGCPDDAVDATLGALRSLREMVAEALISPDQVLPPLAPSAGRGVGGEGHSPAPEPLTPDSSPRSTAARGEQLPPSPPLRGRGAGGEGAAGAFKAPLTPGPSPRSTGARGEETAAVLDADLFRNGLRQIVGRLPSQAQPAVVGAAAGILYGEGLFSDDELVRLVRGYLAIAGSDPRKGSAVLRGLFGTARESAWQVGGLLKAVDEQFTSWDEPAFLAALPELRLAFAALTPRETVKVAEEVAGLHGEETLGDLVHTDLDEGAVRFALEVTQRVRESLVADGLLREGGA